MLIAFIFWSLARKDKALLDLSILKHRGAASSSALQFLTGVALYGAMFLLPLYFQQGLGVDTLTVGLLLIPQGVGSLFSRGVAGRLTDTFGARSVAVIGFLIIGITTIPFAFATPTTNITFLMIALLLRGFGLGAVTIPLTSSAYIGLDRQQIPDASIIVRTAQQLGGSFGVAVLAVVFQATLSGLGAGASITMALNTSFWWTVGFTGLAVILALLLPGRPKPATTPGTQGLDRSDAAEDAPSGQTAPSLVPQIQQK